MRESGENYLETIYVLGKRKAGVHAVDIAAELNFSKPSVTKALGKLKRSGYIQIDVLNHVILTETGFQKAKEIYECHQVIAKFWVLHGVSPETAAKDACRMEHDISAETLECIKEYVQSKNVR